MTPSRFAEIARKYPGLRLAVLGDFCLDRYLEIDAGRAETSIETDLPVHNIARVRSNPGGAGTIVNNLAALGVGRILPVGFAGEDGEGWELRRALASRPGVDLGPFVSTPLRRTFTYTKPLVVEAGRPPRELNRLDIKNWTPTPPELAAELRGHLRDVAARVDAVICLEQVESPGTGVLAPALLEELAALAAERPDLLIIADSRRGLEGFPPVTFKMNRAEYGRLAGISATLPLEELRRHAAELARRRRQRLLITLAGEGILGVEPTGATHHVPAHPIRGEIDIVGAGDAVTASLGAALAAGAAPGEALEIAMAAASVVVHRLGTTGTATPAEIGALLGP